MATTITNIINNISIDFCKDCIVTVFAKQYDKKTRYIKITCYDNGKLYKVPTSCYLNVKMITPDNRAILNTKATVNSDGTITVELTESMLYAGGIGKAEIKIYNQEKTAVLSTMNFQINIKPSPYSEDRIVDSDEFSALTELYAKMDAFEKATVEAENKRNQAESVRVESENKREANEKTRQSNETTRISNENTRKKNEETRISNENTRINSENTRKSNENTRQTNESIRQTNETTRKSNEDTRQTNEDARKKAETSRVTAETARAKAESDRQSKEATRQTNETNRVSAEKDRSTNEDARKTAEADRVTEFANMQKKNNDTCAAAEKVNITTVTATDSYKIKTTDRTGTSTTSPNLINKIAIGSVETGDFDETATASITGAFGAQKLNLRIPTGKPFKIKKTYSSIVAMNKTIATDLELYEFCFINTGSVEDVDTGKLYMRDTNGAAYITDLSGAQGIQGLTGATPNLTIGTVTTGAEGSKATATITGTKENPVLNLTIPKGATGEVRNVNAGTIPYASNTDTNTIKAVVDKKENISKYDFENHNVYRCLGTATLKQAGDYLSMHIHCGDGYNASTAQDRTIDVHIRTSNGTAVNDKYYAGYVESHLNGSTNAQVYVVQNSSTSFTIWIGKLNYPGKSYYEVRVPSGDTWASATNTSATVPTNGVVLTEKKIAYTDSNITGNAATATALTSSAGSATQPVYFKDGKPVATTYTLGKSVPSTAVFTDTTYSAATQSANGLLSASDKKKLDGIASGANAYSLPTASSSTLGGVKTTSTVTSNSGYTACPIISGVPYYKDTNTTYSLAGLMGSSAKGSATQPVYWTGSAWATTTYTLGKSVPSDAKFTDTNTWRGIQNNLTSTSTTDSLSAAQGKALKDSLGNKANSTTVQALIRWKTQTRSFTQPANSDDNWNFTTCAKMTNYRRVLTLVSFSGTCSSYMMTYQYNYQDGQVNIRVRNWASAQFNGNCRVDTLYVHDGYYS